MRAFVAIVLLGASSIWGTFTANAQTSIEAAEALYERGALTDALQAFEEALDEGPHSTASLASIYWHLGTLKMSAGEREEASTYFARALALDPRARVPEELPPEPQAIFRSLQEVAHRMVVDLDMCRLRA